MLTVISPFNENAIGLNAVLGVTSVAAGALGAGYGIGALIAEPSMGELLDAVATRSPSLVPFIAVQPLRGGLHVTTAWTF